MVQQRGRLQEDLDTTKLVTQPMRGRLVRRSVSQLLSSIENVGGNRGFWLKLPRTSLVWPSQLRRGRSGEPGRKGWDLGIRAERRIKNKPRVLRGGGCWVVEKEGRRERSERWRDATFILHKSGGGAVYTPCLIQWSQFPNTDLPRDRLLLY
jgi:hypothetical protein